MFAWESGVQGFPATTSASSKKTLCGLVVDTLATVSPIPCQRTVFESQSYTEPVVFWQRFLMLVLNQVNREGSPLVDIKNLC